MKPVEKVVRDGKVAVLVSPQHGAGWYSWNDDEDYSLAMLFDPEIVGALERDDRDAASEIAERKYPSACRSGMRDLVVQWVPQGTAFRIHEYDGYESIQDIAAEIIVA